MLKCKAKLKPKDKISPLFWPNLTKTSTGQLPLILQTSNTIGCLSTCYAFLASFKKYFLPSCCSNSSWYTVQMPADWEFTLSSHNPINIVTIKPHLHIDRRCMYFFLFKLWLHSVTMRVTGRTITNVILKSYLSLYFCSSFYYSLQQK